MELKNRDGKTNSLQISHIGTIESGEFRLANNQPFLIKNITEETLMASVKLEGNNDFVVTTIYPGWNVEIVEAIKSSSSKDLQYGY